jgi:hypothetical protein
MIELTHEQSRELERPESARVRDPRSNRTYVLVPADEYERLRSLMESEGLPDGASLMNEAMAEDDARDPLLASYQHYRREG